MKISYTFKHSIIFLYKYILRFGYNKKKKNRAEYIFAASAIERNKMGRANVECCPIFRNYLLCSQYFLSFLKKVIFLCSYIFDIHT